MNKFKELLKHTQLGESSQKAVEIVLLSHYSPPREGFYSDSDRQRRHKVMEQRMNHCNA